MANIQEADTRRTPLHYCAERGHTELTQFLAETAGADINAVDHLGWSPLHAACSAGQTVIVYYLLKCVCGPPLLQDRRGIHGIVRERKSIWSLPQDALH